MAPKSNNLVITFRHLSKITTKPLCAYWYEKPIITQEWLRCSIALVAECNHQIVAFWSHQLSESQDDVQKSIVCVEPSLQRQGCATQLWLALTKILQQL